MNKKEFNKISDMQCQLYEDVVDLFDDVKKNNLSEKEAECVHNLYSRLRLIEQRVFDAILGSDYKNFNKKAIKKFISLCERHINELRLIGKNFKKKEISKNGFNSMLILYKKLDGSLSHKILKAIGNGFGDDQIQELYNEIHNLRIKSGLKP
jgi:hypothetical protein